MENGLFSTEEFGEWSKKYVTFLHVTTRLEGHKYDGLLQEKGFTGFPSLAFMDAMGNVIARHSGQRTLEPLKKTADSAEAYMMMREKAEAGDQVAIQHLFVEDIDLRRYDFTRGSLKLAAMRSKMPAMLLAKAEQRLAGLQYHELTRRLRKKSREMPREEYRKQYDALNLEFFQAGLIPEGYQAGSLLATVMNHARKEKDVALFSRALKMHKDRFGDQPRYTRMIERYEAQLADLRDDR